MFSSLMTRLLEHRKALWGILLSGSIMLGCTPQSITIETAPSGAAISVDDEYIGKSPIVYDIENVNDLKRLHIIAEKQGHESTLKRINKKKHSGLFPERVYLQLDPSMSAGEIKAASATSSDQQQATTIQGPTIVVPGTQVTPPESN